MKLLRKSEKMKIDIDFVKVQEASLMKSYLSEERKL